MNVIILGEKIDFQYINVKNVIKDHIDQLMN